MPELKDDKEKMEAESDCIKALKRKLKPLVYIYTEDCLRTHIIPVMEELYKTKDK
jgi:hypothetical protein